MEKEFKLFNTVALPKQSDEYTQLCTWYGINTLEHIITEDTISDGSGISHAQDKGVDRFRSDIFLNGRGSDFEFNEPIIEYGITRIDESIAIVPCPDSISIYKLSNNKKEKYTISLVQENASSLLELNKTDSNNEEKIVDKKGAVDCNLKRNNPTTQSMDIAGYSIGFGKEFSTSLGGKIWLQIRYETNKDLTADPVFRIKVKPNFDFKGNILIRYTDSNSSCARISETVNIPTNATYIYTSPFNTMKKIEVVDNKIVPVEEDNIKTESEDKVLSSSALLYNNGQFLIRKNKIQVELSCNMGEKIYDLLSTVNDGHYVITSDDRYKRETFTIQKLIKISETQDIAFTCFISVRKDNKCEVRVLTSSFSDYTGDITLSFIKDGLDNEKVSFNKKILSENKEGNEYLGKNFPSSLEKATFRSMTEFEWKF